MGFVLAVTVGADVGAEAELDGAEGSAVGATFAAVSEAALGDCAGVALVPPVVSLQAIAAIETIAASIQKIFRIALPVVFAFKPI